jgi:hypothetical protein
MKPKPGYGEETYRGSGGLESKKAVITGGDSSLGRAVALVFACEVSNVLISYLEGVDPALIAGASGGHGVCKTTELPSGV